MPQTRHSREIERALVRYLQTKGGAAMRGRSIVEGHAADMPPVPYLAVYCGGDRRDESMPAESRTRIQPLVIHHKASADDARTTDSEPLSHLAELMETKRAEILAALNATAANVWVHDIIPDAEAEALDAGQAEDEGTWHEQLIYNLPYERL